MQNANEKGIALEVFGRLVTSEAGRCEALLAPFLENDIDQPSADAFRQLARIVGELGARVSVFEQAVEEGVLAEEGLFHHPQLFGELTIEAEAFRFPGLHGGERGENGVVFRWTRTADIEFELPIYRFAKKRLRIFYSHIIKPEYLKEVRVEIDGEPIRLRSRKKNADTFLECVVPPFKDLSTTKVVLSLPAVHAPSELGDSIDNRNLGIALSKISVAD